MQSSDVLTLVAKHMSNLTGTCAVCFGGNNAKYLLLCHCDLIRSLLPIHYELLVKGADLLLLEILKLLEGGRVCVSNIKSNLNLRSTNPSCLSPHYDYDVTIREK